VAISPQRIPNALAKPDSMINHFMTETGVSGQAAAVVQGGKLLYVKGSVNSPGRINASTVFHLASVSKPVSSTVMAGVVGPKSTSTWESDGCRSTPGTPTQLAEWRSWFSRRPWNSRRFELPCGTSLSVVRSGKPVTNQVTTAPVNAGPRQYQPDSGTALYCTDVTQRDPLGRNERPW
jgi:Beta-lactamase